MSDEARGETMRAVATSYLQAFRELLGGIDVDAIQRIASRLLRARNDAAAIYVAGNGGSAAIASHWVNDLCKATKRPECAPMRVQGLSDNMSWLTALANDEGYHRVFSGQLENFARAGDVLVVISSSGNSANLVDAVGVAQSRGLTAIGLLGFDGGILRQQVDDYLLVPTEKGAYGLVEPAHDMVCHILTRCLAESNPSPQTVGHGSYPS